MSGSKKILHMLHKVQYLNIEHYILMGTVYENIIYGN